MALRRTYGAAAAAQVGVQADKARASQEAARRAEERARIRDERAYQDALRKQKLALDLELEERAKRWEIDKMELRSRMDFEREERQRQQKLAERDVKLKALGDAFSNGRITEDEYKNAYLQTVTGVPFYTQAQIAARAGGKSSIIDLWRKYKEDQDIGGGEVAPVQIPENAAVGTTPGTVMVRDKEGTLWEIDADKVHEAVARGGTIVMTPTPTDKRTLPLRDLLTLKPLRSRHSPAGKKFRIDESIRQSPLYYIGR